MWDMLWDWSGCNNLNYEWGQNVGKLEVIGPPLDFLGHCHRLCVRFLNW